VPYNVFLKKWADIRANVFDVLYGHELLSVLSNNAITENVNKDLLYVDSHLHIGELKITINSEDLFEYDRNIYKSLEDPTLKNNFPFVESLKNSKEVMIMDLSTYGKVIPMQKEDKTFPVSHTTLYRLIKNDIIGANMSKVLNAEDDVQADSISIEQIWGSPAYRAKYPTWCNVFAQYLSFHVYGDYLVPLNKNANAIFDFFNTSPHYIELDKSNSAEIWTKYINKGYPVYFSKNESGKSGHIETGFPNVSNVNIYNKQGFADIENSSRLLGGDNQYVIGAGATVGFKSYKSYNWLSNDKTKAFLSLKYLEIEYK
jgi:hypothetical protein